MPVDVTPGEGPRFLYVQEATHPGLHLEIATLGDRVSYTVVIILQEYLVSYTWYTVKVKIHSSCEIEDFVETHLCKLCVILRSRVLRVVCPH